MRRWIALSVLMVSLVARPGAGHEQPPSSLVVSKNWVRFDLVLGRLTATQIRGGQRNCAQNTGANVTRRELLAVTGNGDSPSIRYELTDGSQSLIVEILKRDEVFILREPEPGAEVTRLEFAQPKKGDIKLVLGDPQRPTVKISAVSVWHLLLAEPELCRRELLPIFALLRSHWKLMESANQVEEALFRAAVDEGGPPLEHVRELVKALDSPRFAERQQADQQLRGLGVVVLNQFKQLDRLTLSREQRQRIARIESHLAVPKPDTPERIVAWLLNDQSLWLSMLAREDATKRQIAAARLSATDPAADAFDPLAAEPLRRAQIETLRSRISTRR